MAVMNVASVTLAWAAARYPFLDSPHRTILNSVVSDNVVRDIVIACLAGTVVLLPSLGLLYIFKDQRREKRLSHGHSHEITAPLVNRKVV